MVSKQVITQLAEHIQQDYPKFGKFIESYYKHLEKTDQPLNVLQAVRDNADIDRTDYRLLDEFFKTYGIEIPSGVKYDRRKLIKALKDLYLHKGTAKAFEILFRAFYDTGVHVRNLGDAMFRSSDSVWSQNVSIRVSLDSDIQPDVGLTLGWENNGYEYKFEIYELRFISGNTYEIFLSSKLKLDFVFGDKITIYNHYGVKISSGAIRPSFTKFEIIETGKRFKRGEVYSVTDTSSETKTVFKVTEVGSLGELKKIKLLEFGFGIGVPTQINVVPRISLPSQGVYYSNGHQWINDTTFGMNESGTIIQSSAPGNPNNYYLEDYVLDVTYVGYEAASFNNNLAMAPVDNFITETVTTEEYFLSIATIRLIPQTVCRHPGTYTKLSGIASEPTTRIQDSYYTQAFAYELESNIERSDYSSAVDSLLHPAGLKRFSNRVIDSSVDFGNVIQIVVARHLKLLLVDSIDLFAENVSIDLEKYLNDSTGVADTVALLVNKALQESVSTSDAIDNFSIQKYLSDIASSGDTYTIDYSAVYADSIGTSDVSSSVIEKVLSDLVNATDVISSAYTTGVSETLASTDSSLITVGLNPTDATSVSDTNATQINKGSTDSVAATDSILSNSSSGITDTNTATDTLNVFLMDYVTNPYDYFATGDYVGQIVATA
jgi:hypothetical protein